MITDKQIKEAAIECADEYYAIDLGKDREETNRELFARGAHWAIDEFLKELWHDAKEEPKKNKQCLIEIIYPRPCGLSDDIDCTTSYFSDYGWNEYNFRFTHYAVSRWLYIDDLLSKKGGEE